MKTLKDFNIAGKKVLVRCDFNVPLDEKGNVIDDFRIKKTLPTIEYLIKNRAKVILMSHLGEPEGINKSLSLSSIGKKLEEYLKIPVKMAEDCIGKKVEKQVSELQEGEILLLENLRFHKEEKANDQKFSQELAKLGDIYINDAFAASHRNHASITGVAKYLPSGAGMLLEQEIKILSKVLNNPIRPLVVVIGGVKIETKIKMIKELLKSANHLLIGGKIAEAVLSIKGICVGRPLPEGETMKEIEGIELTSPKIHLPIDALVSPTIKGDVYIRKTAPAKARRDELLLDIGPETINIFANIIKIAKTILWSGPMGFFENPLFEKGTKEIADLIVKNRKAYKIVGGGDTVSAIVKFGLYDKFDHVSTGGGAMLTFLGKENLPGIQALE